MTDAQVSWLISHLQAAGRCPQRECPGHQDCDRCWREAARREVSDGEIARIVVPGHWQPERKRQRRIGTWSRRVDVQEAADAKQRIGLFARQQFDGDALAEPLAVEFMWRKPKPRGYRKHENYPWRRPDLTNLEKLAEDALQDVAVIADDAAICEKHTRKEFGDREELEIVLRRLCDDWPY